MDNIVTGLAAGMVLTSMDGEKSEEPADASVAKAPGPTLSDREFIKEKVIGTEETGDSVPFGPEHWKGKEGHEGKDDKLFPDDEVVGTGFDDKEQASYDITSTHQVFLDKGERMIDYPKDYGQDDQYTNAHGTAEGLDDLMNGPESLDDFFENYKNSIDDGKEFDVWMHYFTNPKVSADEWKTTHKGQFESLKALLKKLVEANLAAIENGTFNLTLPGKKQVNSYINFIDKLPNGKIGTVTTSIKENKRIKAILKKNIRELINIQRAGKEAGRSKAQIEEKLRKAIVKMSDEDVPKGQLAAMVQGAVLTFEQVGEEPDPAPDQELPEGAHDYAGGGIIPDPTLMGLLSDPKHNAVPGHLEPGQGLVDWNDWYNHNEDLIKNIVDEGIQRGMTENQIRNQIRDSFEQATNIARGAGMAPPEALNVMLHDYYTTAYAQWQATKDQPEPNQNQGAQADEPQMVVNELNAIPTVQPGQPVPVGAGVGLGQPVGTGDAAPGSQRIPPGQLNVHNIAGLEQPDFTGMGAGEAYGRTQAVMAQMREMGMGEQAIDRAMASGGLSFAASTQQKILDSLKPKKNPDGDPPEDKKKKQNRKPGKKQSKFSDGTPIDPESASGKDWFKLLDFAFKNLGPQAVAMLNTVMSNFTGAQWEAGIHHIFSRKGCSLGMFFVMYMSNFMYGADFLHRGLQNVSDLLARNDISGLGVLFAAFYMASVMGYIGTPAASGTGTGAFNSITQIKKWSLTFFTHVLKTMAAFSGGSILSWFTQTLTSKRIQAITEGADRVVWSMSYLIPLLVALGISSYIKDLVFPDTHWRGEEEKRYKKGLTGTIGGLFR